MDTQEPTVGIATRMLTRAINLATATYLALAGGDAIGFAFGLLVAPIVFLGLTGMTSTRIRRWMSGARSASAARPGWQRNASPKLHSPRPSAERERSSQERPTFDPEEWGEAA